MNLRRPNINATDLQGQVRQMASFLCQLVDELNFTGISNQREEPKKERSASAPLYLPVGSVYRTIGTNKPQSTFGGRWEQRADDGDEHVWVRIS